MIIINNNKCMKYLEKQKEVFVAFMYFEKAYNRVVMMAMCVGGVEKVL
jgi:cell division GTPase FtsZ